MRGADGRVVCVSECKHGCIATASQNRRGGARGHKCTRAGFKQLPGVLERANSAINVCRTLGILHRTHTRNPDALCAVRRRRTTAQVDAGSKRRLAPTPHPPLTQSDRAALFRIATSSPPPPRLVCSLRSHPDPRRSCRFRSDRYRTCWLCWRTRQAALDWLLVSRTRVPPTGIRDNVGPTSLCCSRAQELAAPRR